MSSNTILTKTLDFTKHVGKRVEDDETFSDVIKYGRFPFEQKIEKITEIEVFSDTKDPQTAVIVGLKVKYKLKDENTTVETPLIPHGVVHVTRVGHCSINDNQLLVGVYGKLKDLKDSSNDGRVASIGFALFDEKEAKLVVEGPYPKTENEPGKAWANFGLVIALQGTKADEVGLTSLGFVNIWRMVFDSMDRRPTT